MRLALTRWALTGFGFLLLGFLLWAGIRAYQDSQQQPSLSNEELGAVLEEKLPVGSNLEPVNNLIAEEDS